MKVTLTRLVVTWSIRTDDGRWWFTDLDPPWTKAEIRRAYPGACLKLRDEGDSVTIEDTKGYFKRGRK